MCLLKYPAALLAMNLSNAVDRLDFLSSEIHSQAPRMSKQIWFTALIACPQCNSLNLLRAIFDAQKRASEHVAEISTLGLCLQQMEPAQHRASLLL